MTCFLLFIIFFRKNLRIYTSVRQSGLQNFGFDNNGSYSYEFAIPESFNNQFTLVLLNLTIYSEQEKNFFGEFDLCSNETVLKNGQIINRNNNTFSGVVKYKTIIYPYLLCCDSDSSIKFNNDNLFLLMKYKNPTTYLDIRIIPQIRVQLIIMIFFIIFIICNTINWVFHLTFSAYLHLCLSISNISFLISHILRFCELTLLNKSDDSHHLTQFHHIFIWISYFFLDIFLLFMSHGLNITTNSIPTNRIVIYLTISCWLSFFSIFYVYYNLGPNRIFILILIFIGFVVFAACMIINIRSSSLQVTKLLMGAPSSIPDNLFYLNNKIYKYFIFETLFFFFLITTFVVIYITCPCWKIWVLEFVSSLIEFISLTMLSYLFRLRPKKILYGSINEEIRLSSMSSDQPLLKASENH